MSQYPPSGPRKTVDDFDDDDDVAQRGSPVGDPARSPGGDRQFTYYPEERYWTDYLRIVAPVLGVIILLALAWFWLSHLIGGGGGAATDTTPTASSNPAFISGSPTSTTIKGTPRVVATPSTVAGAGTPGTTGGPITNGSKVVVTGTGSTGVNMRDAATTSGKIVTTLAEGATLTVTGDSVTADSYTWWPVTDAKGNKGFVVADYLKASP